MPKIKTSPEAKAIKRCILKEYKHIKTKKDLEKVFDECIKSKKVAKKIEYKPVRVKAAEEPGRHLIRWYEDPKTGAIASFFDEPGNVTMRVSTQKGSEEVGFPFASLKGQPEDWFKRTAIKWWKKI